MKQTFAANEMLIGRVRTMERYADEMDLLRLQLQNQKEVLRTAAVTLRAEHPSFYVRRRLDGLLSALGTLDALEQQEGKALREIEKFVGRLRRTDVVDHFSRSLNRRVERIARRENGPRLRTDILRGPLWYRVKVGGLYVAVHGQLRRFQRIPGGCKVELRHGATQTLRTFPNSSALLLPGDAQHNFLAVFSIDGQEIAAIRCDGLKILPALFAPRSVIPVSHPDLVGKLRYGGRLLYIWRSLSMQSNAEPTAALDR